MNPTPQSAALAEEICKALVIHFPPFNHADVEAIFKDQFAAIISSRVGPLVEALSGMQSRIEADLSSDEVTGDIRVEFEELLEIVAAALATEPSGSKEVGQQIVTGMIAAVTDGLRSGEISTKGGDAECETTNVHLRTLECAVTNTAQSTEITTVSSQGAGNVPPEPRATACCVCGGPESKERPGWCADAFCGAVTKPVVNMSDEATDSGATPECDA